jgi:hypothetical protein
MEKIIACCGIDCAGCDARIATLANDDQLREKTAAQWSQSYNSAGITAAMINCTGCREEGAKFAHCVECEIRNCANTKGYRHCSECADMESCAILGKITPYVPDAIANLKSLN